MLNYIETINNGLKMLEVVDKIVSNLIKDYKKLSRCNVEEKVAELKTQVNKATNEISNLMVSVKTIRADLEQTMVNFSHDEKEKNNENSSVFI